MKFLLDTQILLWAAFQPSRLSRSAIALLESTDNELIFSAASIWEISIKSGLDRPDFRVDPHLIRRGLFDNGYHELAITGAHAVTVKSLPPVHKDPFDRMLIAQSIVEGVTFLTADGALARYPGAIRTI